MPTESEINNALYVLAVDFRLNIGGLPPGQPFDEELIRRWTPAVGIELERQRDKLARMQIAAQTLGFETGDA